MGFSSMDGVDVTLRDHLLTITLNRPERRNAMTPDLRRLLTCIGRLEPDRQRMLLLAYYGAFTHEQLAGKLGMPVSVLRNSLRWSLAEIDVCLSL